MTVVIYRDRILAADTGAWAGSVLAGFTRQKIRRLKDGSLAGAAGQFTDVLAFLDWGDAGFPEFSTPDVAKRFAAVVISPDGSEVRTFGRAGWCDEQEFPFTVIGADDFCRGALCAGASAKEAVSLAIRWHEDAAGEVHWLALDRSDGEEVQEPETIDEPEFAEVDDEPEMIPVAPLAMRDPGEPEEPAPAQTWREKRGLA